MANCTSCQRSFTPEISPEMRKAKQLFYLPITLPKRCPQCVWNSLLELAASEDEEPSEQSGEGDRG
jgi:hypothetical protein